jgi:hypothetical protein
MLSSSGSNAIIDTLQLGFSSIGNVTTWASTAARNVRKSNREPVQNNTFDVISRSWVNILSGVVSGKRQATNTVTTAPAIPRATSEAPAVLAGAFWTNSSSSDKPTITILGGNFSKTSPAVEGLGFYNQGSKALTGTVGQQLNGVVRALAIVGDKLFVGGSLSVGNGQGLAIYNLASDQWMTNTIPSLSRELRTRPPFAC